MTYCNAQKLILSADTRGDENADGIRLLLAALGNPERRCVILPVTGEKGKSSVVRMLAGILAHSGVPAVSLILPALDTPKDNVLLGDEPLSISAFTHYASILSESLKAVRRDVSASGDAASLSFTRSELLFALAATVAAETGARWLILEIPNEPFPLLSVTGKSHPLTVVTSCTERVPSAVTSMITRGITEVVSARLPYESSYTAVSSACARAGCRLTVPAFSGVTLSESSLRRTAFTYRDVDYTVPLYGDFALSNALCALEAASALERLGCAVTAEGRQTGLSRAVLPARGAILSVSPTVVVDAASDPFSRAALTELLLRKGSSLGERITLCLGEADGGDAILSSLSSLEGSGFAVTETVNVPKGKEHSTALRLLKNAGAGDLIRAVGDLPFAYAMHVEFRKALNAR